MIKSEILVPLLNANEPEARLVIIHVKDGQSIKEGMLLFTIETTKAAEDIVASETGFIRILTSEGDMLGVGDRLAVVTDTADEALAQFDPKRTASLIQDLSSTNQPADLRITNPALALAKSLGLDLATLPAGQLVTEEVIRRYAQAVLPPVALPVSDKPSILIYGAGGHAKTIMDMVLKLGTFSIVGILDDNHSLIGTRVLNIPVLGTRVLLAELTRQDVKLAANGVGGILDINVRIRIFELLESSGFTFPVLAHPRATIEPSARIEAGAQVFANAYIGSEAVLGSNCMVNTNAVVSHDCEIGAYTHIAPGALLAGHVRVGERTLVGMGVTTAIGVKIGTGVRIGNGANVLADVPDKMIIQAGRFWTGRAEGAK